MTGRRSRIQGAVGPAGEKDQRSRPFGPRKLWLREAPASSCDATQNTPYSGFSNFHDDSAMGTSAPAFTGRGRGGTRGHTAPRHREPGLLSARQALPGFSSGHRAREPPSATGPCERLDHGSPSWALRATGNQRDHWFYCRKKLVRCSGGQGTWGAARTEKPRTPCLVQAGPGPRALGWS